MAFLPETFLLVALFQVKHFLADYPLQNAYMLQKFKRQGWVLPLAAHALVHAGFTLLISLCVKPALAAPLALLDFTVHFTMDRIKASPNLWGRFKALSSNEYPMANYAERKANKYFWWVLGFDQMIHHLSDLVIVFILLL